ncbi:bifunctional copper resistance protein CopD/cytochrome c oxidase assembly protein [Brachybacterium sp. p3-SID1565]|uniref:bifunctional copper resistance protein CopD/cytochrome c oxidase assembly protein n=1 Tax=Brachybacterium sp. p3-SID1565 TaxID=2916046 RepID=UPI0021A3BB4C|nr:bifunctional copper resistance protein CopD/cytochrome c oxidase assembly protein [Brachybacterium sp. p3-SID1565]MCT1386003.1 bifunctional copper resistance protein CopD/cytochrome c oxidase assembly protein [Brachybacterium sp. p3-SID1565]
MTARRLALLTIPALLALTIGAALLGLIATGAAAPQTLVPASPLVTWGVPVVRSLHHLGLLLAVGAGGTAVLLLPGPSRREVTSLAGARGHTVRIAAAGAALWAAASLALVPLGGLEAAGAGSGLAVWDIALSTELGRLQLTIAVIAAISAAFSAAARSTVMAAWGLAFAGIGTGFLGLAGHAGASLDHLNAVNGMAVHLVAVTVWAGGLLVIGLISPLLDQRQLAVTIGRFSPWALAAVVGLAFSGVLSAAIRMSSLAELATTGYGRIVALKALALVGLAVLGALQRRRLGDRVRFRHLAVTEGAVMALVIGASIALGRSAPPVPQEIPAVGDLRVLSLAGFLPPEEPFNPTTMFTEVQPDWVALLLAVVMAGFYIAGVVRLRRRGDQWPMLRTVLFVLGCVAFAWVMSGGAAAYGRFRFDAHMVQHMAMMMIVPPLWVMGGVVTLLSRAQSPRTDGSRGIREWVLAALHSGYARTVSSPPLAGMFFAGSLVVFYFTPLFELAMYHHLGHVLMTVHFLLSGYLFAWVLIGVDPSTRPINPVMKLVTLLVTLAFHAFFGVAVVSATWLIAENWYTDLGMYTGEQLALIQTRGGSIMWAVSEIPTVLYALVVAVQWMRSEDRRATQWDRKADRDGEAELAAYNAYLASIRGEAHPGEEPSGEESSGATPPGAEPETPDAGERRAR